MLKAASAAVVYAALWLLLSGHFEPLPLIFGAVSVVGVIALSWRLGVLDDEGFPLGVLLRTLAFTPFLIYSVAVSNLIVAKLILSPKLRLRQRLVRVHAAQRSDLGRSIHANAITLTPGTISLDIKNDSILVHALDASTASEQEDELLNRLVNWVEGRVS